MTHCHTIIKALRQKGYRLTPQREMIIEALAHGGTHMTADEIFAKIQMRTQSVNIATVYRTLDMLVEEGLSRRTDLGEGQIAYASPKHGPHIHLVCKHCHQIIEADQEMLSELHKRLSEEYSFNADLQHISIFGTCTQCQKREPSQ
ncbi:MAG: Fur family transcriptional regulator [Chloroflexota bacterium]|nr:Fur family transcriptional regulator [Chloroflexota bacterium]